MSSSQQSQRPSANNLTIRSAVTDPTILINVRVTKTELDAIRKRAKTYARGNVSAWVRYAAVSLLPRKEDLAQ